MSNQNRVPKGVPTGGQFAETRAGEAAFGSLLGPTPGATPTPPDTAPNTERVESSARESSSLHVPTPPDPSYSPLTEDALVHVGPVTARVGSSYGMGNGSTINGRSLDDVGQEAAIEVLKAIKSRRYVKNSKAYVTNIVKSQFATIFQGRISDAARRGYTKYKSLIAVKEEQLRRGLTGAEKDRLAQHIYDTWPGDKRRRPPRDFVAQWENSRDTSMNAMVGEDGDTEIADYLTPPVASSESDYFARTESQPFESVLADVGGVPEGTDYASKSQLLDALCMKNGAPRIQPGTISRGTMRKHVALMSQEGVEAAIRDWEYGDDTPRTEALFAPWGATTVDEKDAIVDTLTEHPEYATDLWRTAATKCDRSREKQRQAAAFSA